ncbi:Inner membrane protein CreD [hydrothermal vent metagenome]|uniref:Inner membrane protein CreD n=1 Tax=hydrothermal vent metagenome TaxID=652676 RepID=A0A3B0ZAU7_9ZZZZ
MGVIVSRLRLWLAECGYMSRILLIGILILFLHIPVSMIQNQVVERQSSKKAAQANISAKWGKSQILIGPRIVVPYYQLEKNNSKGGTGVSHVKRIATFLPESLNANAQVNNSLRYRGIFAIPVYDSKINLNGEFTRPNFSKLGLANTIILWNEARLLVEVTDARAIQKKVTLNWNNKEYEFKPGLGAGINKGQGFHVPIKNLLSTTKFKFHVQIDINGSRNLSLAPVGKHNTFKMSSNWKDPSFQGHWLPFKRKIDENGFLAQWRVSDISRNYPQQWVNHLFDSGRLSRSIVGTDFIMTVDSYSMTIRSMKYFLLFVGSTFALIWLLEAIFRLRVYIIQYVFIGLALALFYLLLTALSEHIGFGKAYFIASLLIVGTVGAYSKTVLQNRRRAMMVAITTGLLYVFLYFLLQEAKFSFLIGSSSVFALLVATMYLTRKLDWGSLNFKSKTSALVDEDQEVEPNNG